MQTFRRLRVPPKELSLELVNFFTNCKRDSRGYRLNQSELTSLREEHSFPTLEFPLDSFNDLREGINGDTTFHDRGSTILFIFLEPRDS